MHFTARRALIVGANVTAITASSLLASPASAAESRISPEHLSTIRAGMKDAGITEQTQDSLIRKLQSGRLADSERPDSTPVSTTSSSLPGGGTERIETFADGSQRTESRVPITTTDNGTPITTFTTISCNLLHCTALMSRAQTRTVASGANAAKAVIIALCGPAAWACAIAVGVMVDQANRALAAGKCVGIRRFTTAAPVWPISEPCRQ